MDKSLGERREKLEEVSRRRVSCEKKALHIVQSLVLMEEPIDPQVLKEAGKHLDINYYSDLVIERSVANICGYPLCINKILKIPKQKYQISTKRNQVYDITERKCFCSNFCYKASNCFKDQLSQTPLWLAQNDRQAEISILTQDDMGRKVVLGAESTRLTKNEDLEEFNIKEDKTSSKILELKKVESNIPIKTEKLCDETPNTTDQNKSLELKNKISDLALLATHIDNMKLKEVEKEVNSGISQPHCSKNASAERIPKRKKLKKKPEKEIMLSPVTQLIHHVQQCMSEWLTLDSIKFLLPEKDWKRLINLNQEITPLHIEHLLKHDQRFDEEYEKLCKKMDTEEIFEFSDFETLSLEEPRFKPLPDYETLRKKAEQNVLTVHEFFSGSFNLPESVSDIEEAKTSVTENEQNEYENKPVILPLIDSVSQMTIRRRIILDTLQTVVPHFLLPLGFNDREIMSEIRELVATFRLSSHNISFKPPEWKLVTVFLLNMLGLRNADLKTSLASSKIMDILSTNLNLCEKDIDVMIQEMIHKLLC